MNKFFLCALLACTSLFAFSQNKVTKDQTTVKKTTTVPQKVHNVFSKHKHYSGVKVKHVEKIDKKS